MEWVGGPSPEYVSREKSETAKKISKTRTLNGAF